MPAFILFSNDVIRKVVVNIGSVYNVQRALATSKVVFMALNHG